VKSLVDHIDVQSRQAFIYTMHHARGAEVEFTFTVLPDLGGQVIAIARDVAQGPAELPDPLRTDVEYRDHGQGAEDIESESQGFVVYTTQHDFEAVRDAIKKAGIEPDEAEVKKLADNNIALEGAKAQQLLKLVEALDDHDDVQNVWDNSDISEKEMEEAAAG